jgi:hypothetical protein
MKKILVLASALLFVLGCSKEESTKLDEKSAVHFAAQRGCGSMHVLEEQLKSDPSLGNRMRDIETFTQEAIASNRLVNGVIEIPVVVNVLYRTTAENISLAQIQSQIDVLNQDFNGQNPDFNLVPADFSGVKANVGIRFVLEQVIRKSTNKTSWGTRNDMKNPRKGGIAPTSPATNLNMWVCTIGGGILGYAQFPGGSLSTDGVVIDSRYFGNTGTATAPFNKGRTATHEVGHWMNLRHIWGDATCGNDFVADTPVHNGPNYGCPSQPHFSTCSGTPREMTMNYMDYSDDACMYMFSNGQKSRMLAIFAAGGPRNSFAQ